MSDQAKFFYLEQRLAMSFFGRFLVRLVLLVFYSVLIAATFIFLLSDVAELRLAGTIFFLFLLHRIFHIGRPDALITSRAIKYPGNVARFFAPVTYRFLERALDRALTHGGDARLHLMSFLVELPAAHDILERLECDAHSFSLTVRETLAQTATPVDAVAVLAQLNSLAELSFQSALRQGARAVLPVHLFAALGSLDVQPFASLFRKFNIAEGDVFRAMMLRRALDLVPRRPILRVMPKHRFMNRAWTARPTPTLDRFSQDFTDLARIVPASPLFGHAVEYENMLGILSRPGRENVLLVGVPGVGMDDLVMHLAYLITRDQVPSGLTDKRVVVLDLGALASGAQLGELQERIKTAVHEAIAAGNVILYVPNLHVAVQSATGYGSVIAETLLSAVRSDACSVIGSTYPLEYRTMESVGIFRDTFQVVRVKELEQGEAMEFLVSRAAVLETGSRGKLRVGFVAIRAAVFLGHAYFREKPLPASAEDLLNQAFGEALQRGERMLTRVHLERLAERLSSIPIHIPGSKEAADLLNFEARVHEKFVDQEEAVVSVGKALREYRAGLARKGVPVAIFLFVGPTGVGKTELAKLVAEFQFGNREAMIRFDMTEYQATESINVLIGSPNGERRGTLTEAVRLRPYSLLLLDEFEKAHPDILNLFLQVFDDARLTDSTGETVDFQNTIIIATSNAHSEFVRSKLEAGLAMEAFTPELIAKLADVFRPELLNRFSRIVVFKALSPVDVGLVAKLKLDSLAKALLNEQGITLSFDEVVVEKIATIGFDPAFGARPLDRAIADYIKDPLAQKILAGGVARGATIVVKVHEGKIVL